MNQTLPAAAPGVQPRIIPRAEHNISRTSLSGNALRVLYRLKEAGYQAFLVGGCVRDVMLGRHPKDFDVATNALPDEVRSLFRNSRLVGRRFRLAHVVFGREVIEVATFRAASAPLPSEEPVPQADPEEGEAPELDEESELDDDAEINGIDHERVLDTHGRLLRDNVYGTIDEDVWRRDFTANALYYNIADFSLWDYVGGAEDIAAQRLRLIGDPETRYREDPVRMLRAARFEAKLGFTLDDATAQPIERLRGLMSGVPAARLFDETLKLFLTGHGVRSYEVLRRRGLLGELFPAVERYLSAHPGSLVEQLLVQGLRNTDTRVAEDKPVTPTFLVALLLYGPFAQVIESLPPARWHELGAIVEACDRALRAASGRVTIPRRVALGVREMYALQPRLEHPRGKRALRLLEQPRFRSAFDLLMLRAELGLAPKAIADWWTQLQAVDPAQREAMVDAVGKVRGRAAGAHSASAGAVAGKADAAQGEAAVAHAEQGEGAAPQEIASPPAAISRFRLMHWYPAYVGLGSNLDDPAAQVQRALAALAGLPESRLWRRSSLYGSKPMGPAAQPDFVNAVAALLTQLPVAEFFAQLRQLERSLGRSPPRERWGPRRIDLDLLLFAQLRLDGEQLRLPHPGIVERNFVLYPLAELAPELPVPGRGLVAELASRVTSTGIWRLDTPSAAS